ncbi:MAG TPA: hypothetical protein GXZ27_08440 [Thermoanaerobacterales bacterium]|jgi:hypothetical protein|nr:hypothetical protein [Thermoanaerobacterales bacterium]
MKSRKVGYGNLLEAAIHERPSNQGRRTADNNELQAPCRLVKNPGNSGTPTQIRGHESCKTRRTGAVSKKKCPA